MSLLPTKPTPVKQDPRDLITVIYGPPKIGKSTFCAQADGALFIATEPGLNHLEVSQVPVQSWSELGQVAAEVAGGKHDFRTVVVDTMDVAYEMCLEHVCAKHGIEHPGDMPHGKGWGLVTSEFKRVISKLARLPYGLILTSHTKNVEEQTRTGEYIRTVPSLGGKAGEAVRAMADVILYATTDAEGNRIIQTKPHRDYIAGDRTGTLPDPLPLDYTKFAAAFKGKGKKKTK